MFVSAACWQPWPAEVIFPDPVPRRILLSRENEQAAGLRDQARTPEATWLAMTGFSGAYRVP